MGHKSEDIDSVQDILRIVRDIKETTAVSSLPPGHYFTTSDLESIDLPNPRPLLPFLLEAGFGHEIAAAASKAYQVRANELRRRVQESIIAACREVAELPMVALASSPEILMKKLVSIFSERYLRRLEQWKDEIIRHIKQTPKTPTEATPRTPRNFNQGYVPLLERFFEENPFPTHADKVFLAKKSNMQYKQIHVWFQNRRNRSKKEGKPLRRKPTTKPLGELRVKKGHILVHKSSTDNSITETEVAQGNISKDRFASSSPPHAFPAFYPPNCNYDPFPCKTGLVHFDKPEWRRVPCGKLPLSVSTSIDDLIESFFLLNVRGETRSRESPKLQSHAATAAITVIPSPAPHPSLVSHQYVPSAKSAQLHPSVRAPASCSKVFQSPGPTSKPVTLIPADESKSEPPRKRKTAPLPRRFPGRMQSTSRDTSPSESSSASSSPRLFSTDSESRSCSFSSVNSTTSSSIPELSHSSESRCRSSLGDLRRLGDMVALLPSPVS